MILLGILVLWVVRRRSFTVVQPGFLEVSADVVELIFGPLCLFLFLLGRVPLQLLDEVGRAAFASFAHGFGSCHGPLDYCLLSLARKFRFILSLRKRFVDDVRLDDGRVGLVDDALALNRVFPFQKLVVGA